MADWSKVKIIDGWRVARDRSGFTLTAQMHSDTREALPKRGDTLPYTGINAPPAGFISYVVSEIDTVPVSSAGPYLAQVNARAWLGSSGSADSGKSLLATNNLRAGYMDFQCKARWSALQKNPGGEGTSEDTYGIQGYWVSAIPGDQMSSWNQWKATLPKPESGCPFRKRPHPRHADENIRMLLMTVDYYEREKKEGLEKWGGFSGIVPINSMPKWLTIPGGDNRWRLWDENVERAMDTDGSTRLLHVTRMLMGIPPAFKDVYGDRMEWDQDVIGQRDWSDL